MSVLNMCDQPFRWVKGMSKLGGAPQAVTGGAQDWAAWAGFLQEVAVRMVPRPRRPAYWGCRDPLLGIPRFLSAPRHASSSFHDND